MKLFSIVAIVSSLVLTACAHQEIPIEVVKVVPAPLVHNLYVQMSVGKKRKSRKVASLPEEELMTQLDQNCAYQFEGQLKHETFKVFQLGGKAIAVGACVAPERAGVTGDPKILPIYGKYRVKNFQIKEEHKAAMRDMLKQKCSLKYQGKLSDHNVMTWTATSDGTYLLGECLLPPAKRGISSFDTLPDGEKSF